MRDAAFRAALDFDGTIAASPASPLRCRKGLTARQREM